MTGMVKILGGRVNQLTQLSVSFVTRRCMAVPSGDCRELAVTQGAAWDVGGCVSDRASAGSDSCRVYFVVFSLLRMASFHNIFYRSCQEVLC